MSIPNSDTIVRFRGDTRPVPRIVQDNDNVATDISGWSFSLTVNKLENPGAGDAAEFTIVGTITDAVNGKVEFQPSVGEAALVPAIYWYDIQAVDSASLIETLAKGMWDQRQDVTK